MKCKIAVVICLLFATLAHAQNLTGVWRGSFYSGVGFLRQQSRYEVQINHRKDGSLRGVTYSYKSTVFYGKARLKGIFFSKSKTITFKEDTLLEMRSAYGGGACLFNCQLDYNKQGNKETLEGTYTSESTDKKEGNCGSGTIYLERVPESDFVKEDFLQKKNAKPAPAKPAPAKPSTTVRPLPKALQKDSAAYSQLHTQQPRQPLHNTDTLPAALPIPPALIQRENELVQTITTTSPDIKIELYDNGEIDGDTITVYHNNQVIAYKKGLGKLPITLNVTATAKNNLHEFVMYADNLGKIPPNTALMVVTTGGQRQELFITSNNKKNAKVVIEYKPETVE